MSATITNKKVKACGEPLNQSLDLKTSFIKIPFSITANCIDPQVSLTLLDSTGKVLAQKTFNVETTTKEKSSNTNWIIIILAIIILVATGFILKKKKDNSNDNNKNNNIPIGVLFLFISLFALGTLFRADKASADTAIITDVFVYTFTLSLNKNVSAGQYYLINENIGVNGNVTISGCGNSFPVGSSITATGFSNSTTFSLGNTTKLLAGISFASDNFITFDLKTPNKTGQVLIPYRVVDATVDVQVNGVQGPITVNGASSVAVTCATSTNATSCTCQCRNPITNTAINCGSITPSTTSCGTGIGLNVQSNPPLIPGIIVPTKFYVNCLP